MRTISEPARQRAATWRTVASMSAVSVLVMDWTTIGCPPPTITDPTATATVLRRGFGPALANSEGRQGAFMTVRSSQRGRGQASNPSIRRLLAKPSQYDSVQRGNLGRADMDRNAFGSMIREAYAARGRGDLDGLMTIFHGMACSPSMEATPESIAWQNLQRAKRLSPP